MTIEPFLYCGLTAALLLSMAWRPWRQADPGGAHADRQWGGTLANALGWAASTWLAYYALKGRLPDYPPTEAEQYWAYAALLCLVPSLLEGRSWLGSSLLGAGIVAALAWLSSEPLREYSWEGSDTRLQLGGALALGVVAFFGRPRPTAAWAAGPSYPAALALATGGAAGVLGQSYGGAAHTAGALAFFPGILALIAMMRPRRRYWPGLASAWSLAIPGLLLVGVWFAETPWTSAILVTLSPQLARLPLGHRAAPRLAATVHGALVAAVGALAIWLAIAPPTPYGG